MTLPRFHLTFPVHDLELARDFYVHVLGCSLGRESEKWIDFNMHGHQIVAHLSPADCSPVQTNQVDGDKVPVTYDEVPIIENAHQVNQPDQGENAGGY